jgi:UDP:flavonoid glycosyltransferase YjiC (YdhE family)
MRIRIDFVAPPFAGHLHPILGMARALCVDHEVRVLTTAAAEQRVRAAGLEAVTLLRGWDQRLADLVDTPDSVGSNPIRLMKQLSNAVRFQQQIRCELMDHYRAGNPDLVIADFTLAAVGGVANALKIPWWSSLPSPCILDGGDGPPCYLGGLKPAAGVAGLLRDRLGWAAIKTFKRTAGMIFRARMREFGLPAVYRPDGSEASYSNEKILALGWRDLEFRSVWPAIVRFLPPFLYTPPAPAEQPRFAPGKKHVLVTLGTHVTWAKDRFAAEIQRLASQLPQVEFHFADGRMDGRASAPCGNFLRFPYIDYGSVAQYDLVIHHGGAGIVAHCIATGRPSIVCPVDYDQFDYAARLEYFGIGYRLRNINDLPRLVQSILGRGELRQRCAEVANSRNAFDASEQLREIVHEWSSAGLGQR